VNNTLSFLVRGRYALFSDPVTRIGGEKCSYPVPTYEALKGVTKSVYWKPTLIWFIKRVRILNAIRTQSKGVKPISFDAGGNTLSIYAYLLDVCYQVEVAFTWNEHRPELAADRIDGKHYEIARRMIEKGGRQDVFLGTRECQGYVEPCRFGEDAGAYDDVPELAFGLMFHSFDYPDETGINELAARFWPAVMRKGIIEFPLPSACPVRKYIRPMRPKVFDQQKNCRSVSAELEAMS
jgi:CRISPR-associated protein Cas5d